MTLQGPPEGTVIPVDDVTTVQTMPVESVLLCRLHEVFQSKTIDGNGPHWFALGYPDIIWPAEHVAAWGPLLIIYNPTQEHPTLAVR